MILLNKINKYINILHMKLFYRICTSYYRGSSWYILWYCPRYSITELIQFRSIYRSDHYVVLLWRIGQPKVVKRKWQGSNGEHNENICTGNILRTWSHMYWECTTEMQPQMYWGYTLICVGFLRFVPWSWWVWPLGFL